MFDLISASGKRIGRSRRDVDEKYDLSNASVRGLFGDSSAAAPDYVGAAQTTADGNLANLKYQTTANRPTIDTPWGTESWSAADLTTGAQTETIGLSADSQAALDAQQEVGKNQSELGQYMQGQVGETMANGFNAPSISSYMGNTGSVNSNYANFDPTGTGTSQTSLNSSGANVNMSAPQYSNATAQAGAQAAYTASHALVADQQNQDTSNLDSQLRLQGLTPGTEAYNNAAQNLSRTQDQQNDQLASAAVQTGDQEANADYASALSGYNAQNAAVGQQYNQDANTMTEDNAGQNQEYSQALAGYGADQTAQTASNTAEGQDYSQSLQNYNTAYNSAYQNYNMPLNEMNAVLNGNQVSSPNFGSYSQAGYVGGADDTTAAQNAGQYSSAATAAANSSTNSELGMAGSAAAAAIMYY